jgi:glycerol-3-phosphate O-acyltransferase
MKVAPMTWIAKVRSWLAGLFQGSPDLYTCELPRDMGPLSRLALRVLFRGITLSPNQLALLDRLPRQAIPVYVIKNKSRFERLFYFIRYLELKRPVPELALDYRTLWWQPVGRLVRMAAAHFHYWRRHFALPDPYRSDYIRRALLGGQAALLSLVEPRGFHLRFVKAHTDPLHYLIDLQAAIDRPIYLIPHLMLFSRNPAKSNPPLRDLLFGPESRPGRLRRLVTLFKKPGKIFVELSEPVDLRAFLDLPEVRAKERRVQALLLRRNLMLQMTRHRQSILGPVLKSRLEIKEGVLTSPRLQAFMQAHAASENTPLTRVHNKAESYFEEIAANYSPPMIEIYRMLLNWIINTIFDGFIVDQDGLDRLKTFSQRGPLILLPCHKSHIDYLMLSYVMYHNNMPCPHIAAGKNLAFWPLGPLFRRGGAFFMRRTFRGQPLYAQVFAAYVFKLLQEGFNIEVFIEGGRSRTGKLLSPKTGLLSMLLEAFQQGACPDLILAPIFIGYDKVPEEKAYLHELEGGHKEPESLAQVLKARTVLKKRFGKIYIQFHTPMSLKEILAQGGLDLGSLDREQRSALCRNLGHRTITAINRVAVVTPHALLASAVLNLPKAHFTQEDLRAAVDVYLGHLHFHDVKLADTLVMDPQYAITQVFDAYLERKFVEPLAPNSGAPEENQAYQAAAAKRPSLEYYKNNCVAHFIPAAFTAMAIFERDAFQFSSRDLHASYLFQRDLFKYEFSYDIERPPEYFVRRTIKAFIEDAVLMPHQTLPDTYNVTSAGFRKLKLYANFLRTFLESYWIVLGYLLRHPTPADSDPKDLLKKIEARGERMVKRGEIEHGEALSRVNFRNAVTFFQSRGLAADQKDAGGELLAKALQAYLGFLQ